MARRNKRPASIDAAPILRPVYVVRHTGLNRHSRRWARIVEGGVERIVFRHNWRAIPVINEPHRILTRPLGRTGATVRMPARAVR